MLEIRNKLQKLVHFYAKLVFLYIIKLPNEFRLRLHNHSKCSFPPRRQAEQRSMISMADQTLVRRVKSINVVDFCWGCTTRTKSLTLMALNLEGSLSANCLRTCLPAKPNEHKPCRMGFLKPDQRAFSKINKMQKSISLHPKGSLTHTDSPPMAAKLGSIWRGFQSPLRRYKAAWKHKGSRHCLNPYLIHKPLNFLYTEVVRN